MKEKMLEFLENNFWTSGRDNDIVLEFINDFCNSYQPERLSPEDHFGEATEMISDSLNS